MKDVAKNAALLLNLLMRVDVSKSHTAPKSATTQIENIISAAVNSFKNKNSQSPLL